MLICEFEIRFHVKANRDSVTAIREWLEGDCSPHARFTASLGATSELRASASHSSGENRRAPAWPSRGQNGIPPRRRRREWF
jgi:hypothetical protein